MTERYISVTDDEYVYFLDTQSEDYKTLEDFEKIEFEEAQKDNVDIKEYEDAILQSANDNYWDWVYDYHIETDTVNDLLNSQEEEITFLKSTNMELEDANARLEEKNIELQERNDRQYDKLTHLWECIRNKDYETLQKELEEIEEADKKLQEEWKCYK